MSFLINNTTASTSASKRQLDGNQIHKVIFRGCEAVDITGKDDKQYKILKIKFENESGLFEDSIFEPSSEDMKRPQSAQGYEQPSGVEYLMAKIRHLIAAVNPALDKAIEDGTKTIEAKDWKGLRDIVVKATNKGIGTEVEIKLLKNKSGYAIFPRYFLGIKKDGATFFKRENYFIGNGLAFNEKELKAIKDAAEAKPTDMAAVDAKKPEAPVTKVADDDFDF